MNYSTCKVSIVTVSYNSVKTIEQTIKSVLRQSYKNIEYIVIDGDSTDGTQQIIEKYADRISYYVSEKDKGLYYAMNKGIQKATGDIIGIINSDDWYAETAAEDVVKCFQQSDVEAVYGLTVNVEADGTEKKGKVYPIEEIWYRAPFQHPSVFVKTDIYGRFGGYNTNYKVAADYDFLLRCYSENVRFEYCDKVIAYFRRGGISTTHRETGSKENYKISMSYINKCAYKDSALPKIKETYKWEAFSQAVHEQKGLLCQLLYKYFDENITTIIIFGTGNWAERCHKNLENSDIRISYFSDNDATKWGTYCHGIKVVSPERLQEMTIPVLIAVKEHGEEIKRQLSGISNVETRCVTIKEIESMYCLTHN